MSDGEEKPDGFSFAGIAAGLKDSNKKDLALICLLYTSDAADE